MSAAVADVPLPTIHSTNWLYMVSVSLQMVYIRPVAWRQWHTGSGIPGINKLQYRAADGRQGSHSQGESHPPPPWPIGWWGVWQTQTQTQTQHRHRHHLTTTPSVHGVPRGTAQPRLHGVPEGHSTAQTTWGAGGVQPRLHGVPEGHSTAQTPWGAGGAQHSPDGTNATVVKSAFEFVEENYTAKVYESCQGP